MIISRKWAMPNKWTFQIKPIKELLGRYVGDGKGWIDPFAGENSPAEFTNDINPQRKAEYHMDALDFCNMFDKHFKGIVFDPPYSCRQVSECYKNVGMKATQIDTSARFYTRIKEAICNKIEPGGYAISFGWNSNGFGNVRGFKKLEILLVAHGGSHNDTIIVVEQRINNTLDKFDNSK